MVSFQQIMWAIFQKVFKNKFRVTFKRIRFIGAKLKFIVSRLYLNRGTFLKSSEKGYNGPKVAYTYPKFQEIITGG